MVKFTFATEKEGFDEHINKSIRGYQDLWDDILKFSKYFVEDGTTVIDIGCSTGRLLKAMKSQNDEFAPGCVYRGIELEPEFFKDLVNEDNLEFVRTDIREFDWARNAPNCSLVTSIFSLQFLPKRDRQAVIDQVFRSLSKGGAFIFSEKVLGTDPQVEEMLTFCYYDWKRTNFTAEEILAKEQKLRSMMKPISYDEILSMVKAVGFNVVQPFWQNFHFVGVMALKH